MAATLEQGALASEPPNECGVVPGERSERGRKLLGALADPIQMLIEPGGLRPDEELERFDVRIQELRPPGQDGFLARVIGAPKGRIGSRYVEGSQVVRLTPRPESR